MHSPTPRIGTRALGRFGEAVGPAVEAPIARAAEWLAEPSADVGKIEMRQAILVGLAALLLIVVAACGESEPEGPPVYDAYPPMEIDPLRPYSVTFTTSVGRISFLLLPEEAPLAVNSFIFLANEGYFDGVAFHRVIPGVLAETGDATGTGTGNPGYTFEVEPPQRPYERGGIALANDGSPNSNGSRFFFILGDLAGSAEAPHDYTVFGHLKPDHAPSVATLDKIEAAQEEVIIRSLQATEGCLPSWGGYGPC